MEADVLTAELFAIRQALAYLNTTYTCTRAVIYTDPSSPPPSPPSRRPASSTVLAHTLQRLLLSLTSVGWKITLQWVPSTATFRGNEVADAAAKMALSEVSITPLPLPLSTAKRLISKKCRSAWDRSLGDALRATSMGQYRTDSSLHPWIRQTSRVLDVALTRLRIGHTTLTAQCSRVYTHPTNNDSRKLG
ncbi:hypothetical protein GWK47_047601 [Chionoecetes opilio]|uniref:RNase H type-1 domain-containing protein n=1 Tax=Chionoecetes opilio TaxID=41210 RepID=A0A8J5CG71_CHIOP|nr:hypothetical protein GWK47_047601 [Chionoecetes opilio]